LRPVVRFVGLAAMAMLLSACIKVDLSMRLHSDETVDGTMVYAVSRDLLTLTHSTADDLLGQVASGGPLPGISYETSEYADDTFVGKTLTFHGVPLATFSQGSVAGESLKITRVGDTFQVEGQVDLTRGSTGQLQPGAVQLAKDMQLRLAITFPGPVQDQTGGTVDPSDPNTVVWTPAYGTTTQIRATGSALGDSTSNVLVWILLGVAVVVVAVVVWVLRRTRRARRTPAAEPVTTASGPADPTPTA
jgi:LppM domain